MLLSEIKEVLKKYEQNDLRLLVLEMYKAMPKKLREDKDIDALLQDLQSQLNTNKNEKTSVKQTDVMKLKVEINQFINYAYKQYYFTPNNYVRKNERPKWRFKVKAYIKDLQAVPINSENGKIATDLIENLYAMLSYACGYYIFNTEDPFRSVGIEQTELLDIVIKRKFLSGISNESVKSAISLVINSYVDRETLHSSLINLMIGNLKTASSKEIALEQCAAIKTELEKSRPLLSKKTRGYDNSEYEYKYEYKYKEINNYLVEVVIKLYIELCEYDTAIEYFNKYHIQRDKEVSLYIILQILRGYELKDYWLREYEDAVEKSVKPRESLMKMYNYIRKNNEFPETCEYLNL